MMMEKKPSRACWGLYSRVKENNIAVPLKSLDINIQILHNTARVFYTQIYQNESQSLLESEFFFPISPNACFDSFEAKFNETVIKGVIKEKKKAQEEYKEAVSEGRTAAYTEINEETGDIMKVLIGNIPPKTEISIVYSYIEKLETSLNKFWCFRLFSTITPRYNGNLNDLMKQDIALLSNYPTVAQNSSKAYPWSIKAEIQSPSPITLLKSPSHDIVATYGNENHTCTITLNPNSTHFPNKDFILLYTNGKEGEKTDFVLTPFEDGYCAMVSLMADFEKSSGADAYKNFVKAKEIENQHSMDTIRGEYVFLIDRSGSMGGDRIEMAKSSLLLFLKSLPKDSFCNVVSFGSNFDLLEKESVVYSKESVQSFSNKINGFSANMGGTEIYRPLSHIFSTPLKKGYPRFIFLLTDGAVSNTHQVLELIKNNDEKARVFTIGIGNGCSPMLITTGALYGRGKHEFVTENKQIYEKVINLLNSSLSPCYSDFSLESNNFDAVVKSVSPNPATLPFLLNGQTATFFLFLREEAFDDSQKMTLKLGMYDTRIGNYRSIEITLDKGASFENELIPKLAIHDMIKRLEEAQKENKNIKNVPDIYWNESKEEIQKSLLELSLKYGILCKETAFFCDVKENNELHNTIQAKVIVPTLTTHDYNRLQPQYQKVFCGFTSYRRRNVNIKEKPSIPMKVQEGLEFSCEQAPLDHHSFKSKRSHEPGMLNKLSSTFSNMTNSLFTKGANKKSEVATRSLPQASTSLISDENRPMEERRKEAFKPKSDSSKKPDSSYLDVIMKQSFDGSWEHDDKNLIKMVLKDGKLPGVPKELKTNNQNLLSEIWITILVLLWLEIACANDKKAWALIHKKGKEWLTSQGVNYNEVKGLGKGLIKA